MSYLLKTTIEELAILAEDIDLNSKIVFSTEDPEWLKEHNLESCEHHMIGKAKLFWEHDYVVVIGEMLGYTTVAKDINVLTKRNVDNKECRINGIKCFLQEYCEKNFNFKEGDRIYIVMNP